MEVSQCWRPTRRITGFRHRHARRKMLSSESEGSWRCWRRLPRITAASVGACFVAVGWVGAAGVRGCVQHRQQQLGFAFQPAAVARNRASLEQQRHELAGICGGAAARSAALAALAQRGRRTPASGYPEVTAAPSLPHIARGGFNVPRPSLEQGGEESVAQMEPDVVTDAWPAQQDAANQRPQGIAAAASAEKRDWRMADKAGSRSLQEREFEVARRLFRRALRLLMPLGPSAAREHAAIHMKIGASFALEGNFMSALQEYKKVPGFLQAIEGRSTRMEEAGLLVKVGEAREGLGAIEDALEDYAAAKDILELIGGSGEKPASRLQVRIGGALLLQGEHAAAIRELSAAQEWYVSNGCLQTLEGAELLLLLGKAYSGDGQIEQALTLFRQAQEILETETGVLTALELAKLRDALGDVRAKQGFLDVAIEEYDVARQTLESIPQHNESQRIVLKELGRIYGKIGSAYAEFGYPRNGLSAYTAARRLMDRSGDRKTQPKAELMISSAMLHAQLHEYAEALDELTEARRVYERIGKLSSWEGLSLLLSIGDMQQETGDMSKALHVYEQANRLLKKLNGIAVGGDTEDGRSLKMKIFAIRHKLGLPIEADENPTSVLQLPGSKHRKDEREDRAPKQRKRKSFRQMAKEYYARERGEEVAKPIATKKEVAKPIATKNASPAKRSSSGKKTLDKERRPRPRKNQWEKSRWGALISGPAKV